MSVHIDIYIPDKVEKAVLDEEEMVEVVEEREPFHFELRY